MNQFQASIWREGELFVAQCLEIDIASQGRTQDEALNNLKEALELFFETADPAEISERIHRPVCVTEFETTVGSA